MHALLALSHCSCLSNHHSENVRKLSIIFCSHFFCRAIETKGHDLIQLRHMKSYDGLLQSSFMFFMQLVVLFTRPSVGTLHGVANGRCKQLKIISWIFLPFFSLDPGDWPDQQPAEPDLGRHHLPHRLRRQAVRILASDQTHAVLPRPLCV